MATPARPAYTPATPAEGMSPEEAKYRVKLLDTLQTTMESKEKLIGGQQRAESQRYSTVVSAIARVEAAKMTGSAKGLMEAFTDIATYQPKYNVDEGSLSRAGRTAAEAGKPGTQPYNVAYWEAYALANASPDAPGSATYGTDMAARKLMGVTPEQVTEYVRQSGNPEALANISRIQDVVVRDEKIADVSANLVEESKKGVGWFRDNPNPTPSQVQDMLRDMPTLADSIAMQAVAKSAERGGGGPVTLSGSAKKEYDDLTTIAQDIREEISGESAAPTERQMMGQVLALPNFRYWADTHGFDIGTVSADGVYTDGPDDMKALYLFQQQLQGTDPVPLLHNRYKGNDQRRTYGEVRVKMEGRGVPVQAAQVKPGVYAFMDLPNGERTYLGPESYKGTVREVQRDAAKDKLEEQARKKAASTIQKFFQEKGIKRAPTDAEIDEYLGRHPPDLSPEVVDKAVAKNQGLLDAAAEELLRARGVQMSSEAPTEQANELLQGQILATPARSKDGRNVVDGSIAIRTANGEVVTVHPDQMVGEPLIMEGGQRQGMKLFLNALRGNVGVNIEQRRKESEVHNRPPWATNLADTLVRDPYTQEEKGRNEDAAYQSEVTQRRKDNRADALIDEGFGTIPQVGNTPAPDPRRVVESKETGARPNEDAMSAEVTKGLAEGAQARTEALRGMVGRVRETAYTEAERERGAVQAAQAALDADPGVDTDAVRAKYKADWPKGGSDPRMAKTRGEFRAGEASMSDRARGGTGTGKEGPLNEAGETITPEPPKTVVPTKTTQKDWMKTKAQAGGM